MYKNNIEKMAINLILNEKYNILYLLQRNYINSNNKRKTFINYQMADITGNYGCCKLI